MLRLYKILPALFILLSFSIPQAQQIKIIPESGIDVTNLQSLVRTVTAGCRTDQEKMIALWGFITRNPFYHGCEARDGKQATTEYGVVHDPVKAFNVYGTVICYQVADMLANMAQEAGITVRTRSIPYSHNLMEAYYSDAWHLFDAQYDCQAYYLKQDGKTIASLNEVDSDPRSFILDQKNPSEPFFQFDHYGGIFWPWESKKFVVEKWFERFETSTLGYRRPVDRQGHTVIISLRRGEKLVRRWDNEGKWYCTAELFERWNRDYTQRWVALGPHDPRNPQNTYANGWLIYEPDWEASGKNFAGSLERADESTLFKDGRIYPSDSRKAKAAIRVRSPYLIVGHPNRLAVNGDSENGACFAADFYRANDKTSAAINISRDNGLTWQRVWEDDRTGEHRVELDLTDYVEGTYSYLIQVEMQADNREDVWFGKPSIRNSIFYSPLLLPGLHQGENSFTVEIGEPTEQIVIDPDFSSQEAFERYCWQVENLTCDTMAYNRIKPPIGESGTAVFRIDPPGRGELHHLTIWSSYRSDFNAASDSVKISYAKHKPEDWQVLWQSAIDREVGEWKGTGPEDSLPKAEHWRFDKSLEVDLDGGCEEVYVKFEINRTRQVSLNDLTIYAHYRPEPLAPALQPEDYRITHTWRANGELYSHTEIPLSKRHTYTVNAGEGEIANEEITIEVANVSDRK